MIAKLVIAANATVSVPGQGDRFTVYASSVPVNVRADGLDSFSQYSQQTGVIYSPKTFSLLEVQNPTANPIVCQIYIGSGESLIDTRNLLQSQPAVAVVTGKDVFNPSAAVIIPILDKSGTVITDPTGKNWYAVQRISATILNGSTTIIADNFYPQFVALNWSGLGTDVPIFIPACISTNGTGQYQATSLNPFVTQMAGNFWMVGATIWTYSLVSIQVIELYQAIAQ